MDLIIDTSSEKLKLILNNNGTIWESEENNQKHLKHLLPEIEKILDKSNKTLNNIDVFSTIVGPGSFTGVRIGVSTIKAFGCVLKNKKYLGINMLELLSFAITQKQKIKTNFCIIIKSTSTKFYFGLANSKGKIEEMKLITLTELQEFINKTKLPLYSYSCAEISKEFSSINIELTTQDYINFCELEKSKKHFVSILELKPVYLALSQAEEELNKRLANESKNS